MNLFPRKKKLFASRAETRRRRNRNRLAVVAVLLVIAGGAVFLANGLFEGSPFAGFAPLSGEQADRQDGQTEDPSPDEGAAPSEPDGEARQEQSPPEEPLPDPEQKTPEAAAYVAVAPQFPGVGPESIGTVYRSRMDPSWASVRFRPGGENKDFVVFSHKEGDLWKAEKSIRVQMYYMAMRPEDPRHPVTVLVNDLVEAKRRGLDVWVILEDTLLEKSYHAFRALEAAGVWIRTDKRTSLLHSKAVIIDGRILFVGSANWSKSAFYSNEEVSVMVESPGLAARLMGKFETIGVNEVFLRRPGESAARPANPPDSASRCSAQARNPHSPRPPSPPCRRPGPPRSGAPSASPRQHARTE